MYGNHLVGVAGRQNREDPRHRLVARSHVKRSRLGAESQTAGCLTGAETTAAPWGSLRTIPWIRIRDFTVSDNFEAGGMWQMPHLRIRIMPYWHGITDDCGVMSLGRQPWRVAVSIVRKLCRAPRVRRTAQEYFTLHKSKHAMPRLTDKAIRYAVRQLEKAKTPRRSQKRSTSPRACAAAWAEFNRTGSIHVQQPQDGRQISHRPKEINMVLDVHGRKPEGVLRTAKRLRKEGHDISYSRYTR